MKRRQFLKTIGTAAATSPIMLKGMPVKALAGNSALHQLAGTSNTDRVLVLVQLHGGNDGLNTLVPMDPLGNGLYHSPTNRPNIALPYNGKRAYRILDSTLPEMQHVGLHPDMTGLRNLYDEGLVSIVQNVGYENMNGSHFRSRDIWFMGGNSSQYIPSGWAGRYLDYEFPGYPEDYLTNPDGTPTEMPDPPAIEIGSSVSLLFHRSNGIPISLAINHPNELTEELTEDSPSNFAALNSHHKTELAYLQDIANKTDAFATGLHERYANGQNLEEYPSQYPYKANRATLDNDLAPQLKLVARLLSGGSSTRIFLVKQGGFDTHADQADPSDSSMGNHAALLYHVSQAIEAFQKDLKKLGLQDRVLTVTFSEFGRRVKSNASFGTDHGSAAPMFIVGPHANPGIIGNNPSLEEDKLIGGNLAVGYDYRQIFASVLFDWLGADNEALSRAKLANFKQTRLPIISRTAIDDLTERHEFARRRAILKPPFPNPAGDYITLEFAISSAQQVKLEMYTLDGGRQVKEIINERRGAGWHTVHANLKRLPNGIYIVCLHAGKRKVWHQVSVQHH